MNKQNFLILLMLICRMCEGQNLIPNPSFEDTLPHSSCITGIEIANHWFNPNVATPDLYSYKPSCSTSSFNNPSGYQLPKTGLCYAGIFTYQLPNTREYIEIKLLDSLQANQDYQVSFFVSRAETFTLAADGIGAYFSNDSVLSSTTWGNLPFIPQIMNPTANILNDTLNWVQISGVYHAVGGEKFITIGNFFDATNTMIDTIPGGLYYSAYYYIDDISVIADSSTSIIENLTNNFLIFPNPFHDYLNIIIRNNELSEIILYDIASRKLLQQKFTKTVSLNTEQLTKGIYFYVVKNKNGVCKQGKVVKD